MQVSVESPSKLERRITVVVPVEKLNEAYNKRIAKLAKNAKIAGFRPGKAPLAVIKQRYGDTAREEALGEVIQSSLYAAIDQEKLQIVGTPTVEPKVIAPDQPLEYVATFEVLPAVEEVNFNLETVEKEVATIADADVEKVLEHLRSQHTHWKKVTRPAQEKDQVVIDFRGMLNGVAFQGGEAHSYPLVLGSKSMIPGFEEGIMGMTTNEERNISVTFPADYFSKELAGKATEFAIKIISVSEPELPEVNEEFIKTLGIKSGSFDDLRAEIQKNLERELNRVISAKMKKKVFDVLLEQNTLDIPNALIEHEANRLHDEAHPHHGDHKHNHTAEEMAHFTDAAKRNVALGLLVAEIVKKHNILVTPERIQAQLARIAAAYENPTEVLNWYASNKKAQTQIEVQVLEDLAVEKLLEAVKIIENKVSYTELVNN